MKICMIVPKGLPVPSVKGGAIETLVTNIVEKNEKYKKIDLTVVSIYDDEAYKETKKYKNTKFIFIKKNIKFYWKSLIVHIKNLFGHTLNTYNEVVLDKIKRINFDYVVAEDGAIDSFYNYIKYFKKEQLVVHFHHAGGTTKNIEKTFSKFIAVSNYVLKEFTKTSKIKENYVLTNGIKIENFDKKCTSQELVKLKNKVIGREYKKDFIVIYCGRLVPEKGILELVQAIKKTNENIKLLIVGSANFADLEESEYTQKLKMECENCERIIFTGFINNNELYKYYRIADLSCIPSLFQDPAPLVCIETMICKVPIITTGTGGIKEYLQDNGIYVSPNENLIDELAHKIDYAYENKEKMNKLAEKAYKNAKRYSLDNYYEDFVDLIYNKFDK